MMEALAAVHFRENPDGPFADADATYVFLFSMIMLNTDLHNDQIRNKMSADQFERSNRGINAGGDLDAAFVHRTYNSIWAREMVFRPA